MYNSEKMYKDVHYSLYKIRKKLKPSEYLNTGNGLYILWFSPEIENHLVFKHGFVEFMNMIKMSKTYIEQ